MFSSMVYKGSLFSTFFLTFTMYSLFNGSPFWKIWDDISLWSWFAFLWWLVMLNIFSCVCWSPVYLLWENVYPILLHIIWSSFLVLVLSHMSCLYILDINHSSVKSIVNIFSHSVGYFFLLSMFSLLCKSF